MKMYGNKYSRQETKDMAQAFMQSLENGDIRCRLLIDRVQGALMFHQGIIAMEETIIANIKSIAKN